MLSLRVATMFWSKHLINMKIFHKLEKTATRLSRTSGPVSNETLLRRENYLFNNFSDQAGLLEVRQSIQELIEEEDLYDFESDCFILCFPAGAQYPPARLTFPIKISDLNRATDLSSDEPTLRFAASCFRSFSNGSWSRETWRDYKSGHIKFFTITFAYPLGRSYSTKEAEKETILSWPIWCVYLVEDDYLGDLDNNAPSFHYLDQRTGLSTSNLFRPIFSLITSMILPQDLLKASLDL